ncbi:hypothetical protein, partial [Nodularia spumigena]
MTYLHASQKNLPSPKLPPDPGEPQYPNDLIAAEYHELALSSAIHQALIEGNFFHIEGESIYDYL